MDVNSQGSKPVAAPERRPRPPAETLHTFDPFCPGFLTTNTVQTLVPALVDSWDKLRQCSYDTLMKLPTPLPGWESPQQLEPIVQWAADLIWSPRIRESDAGDNLIKFKALTYWLSGSIHAVLMLMHLLRPALNTRYWYFLWLHAPT